MRSHYCGQVNESLLDQDVTVCGWVHRRRDHGGIIFVDLRDRDGLLQVVIDPDEKDVFEKGERVRSEYVLKITGKVRRRPEGTENSKLNSGQVEVYAREMEILNTAETPPFQLDEADDVGEEHRLKYRYIDLRRPEMQKRLRLRHNLTSSIRRYMDENGFIDIETPILTKATPEGARDYLVPSRTHPGKFFALPQSPQIFKQLLMMSGFDRYYQIVKCFRDEDLRADRQPEFTQLDVETSFLDEEGIMGLMENLIRTSFKEVLDVELPTEFPRMSFEEAMRRFGSDKPDTRVPLELVEVADMVADCDFKVFSGPAKDPKGRVAALKVPGGNEMTRKEIDDYTSFVGRYGAKGLAYIKVNEAAKGKEGLQSPIVKFLSDDACKGILEATGAQDGDLIFFGADKAKVVNDALGALRQKIGYDRNMVEGEWAPLWVVDFPMFEYDEKDGRYYSMHHPFTAPKVDSPDELTGDLESIVSRGYDMVLNGYEIGGGSVRIHRQDMQSKIFELLGIGKEEAEEKFGFLLTALKHGAPPHGGMAFGLDRLAMLMAGAPNIREVMAFPKTQTAHDPLTDAPGDATEQVLKELNLRIRVKPKVAGTEGEGGEG